MKRRWRGLPVNAEAARWSVCTECVGRERSAAQNVTDEFFFAREGA